MRKLQYVSNRGLSHLPSPQYPVTKPLFNQVSEKISDVTLAAMLLRKYYPHYTGHKSGIKGVLNGIQYSSRGKELYAGNAATVLRCIKKLKKELAQ
jgi:hypothetical protein